MLLEIVVINQGISFMWGAYFVHKRILVLDKQMVYAEIADLNTEQKWLLM